MVEGTPSIKSSWNSGNQVMQDSITFPKGYPRFLVQNGRVKKMKGCIQLIEGDPSSLVVSDSVPMPVVGPNDVSLPISLFMLLSLTPSGRQDYA